MGVSQLVYPSDLARKPEPMDCGCHHNVKPTDDSHCGCNQGVWIVPAPPPIGYPPYPYGPECPGTSEETIKIKTKSIEAQICKLSKKSAAIKTMIDNFENKNKDVIVKIGGTSYNFGPCYNITKEESTVYKDETEYAERFRTLLTDELESIKEKLQELASELDSDDGN